MNLVKENKRTSPGFMRKCLVMLTFILGFICSGFAQCPPNLDFEQGSFFGWTCYTGNVAYIGGQNVITLNPSGGPVAGRHEMESAIPGNGRDPYGNFPINCPNGSGHSIKLGNNGGGAQAEGVSYTFTIPAGQDNFSLIYHYAVVFQDPGHLAAQQPRMDIEILNVTDNSPISCSSFSFIATSGLPGFFLSANPGGATPVWCKNWSANSINLDGNAGKTIRLFFKTADCTFTAHFGYAYIDVNTECGSSFIGATFCPDDTAVNITAPYGYQNYKWFNSTFTQILGTSQLLHLSPPPLSGSSVAVELIPYNGYGCIDTLVAQLLDTLTLHPYAGRDTAVCNSSPVQLGGSPVPGIVYRWSPATGLSDPNISNPVATPVATTQYILSVTHDGGGCLTRDTVNVGIVVLDTALQVTGPVSYCTASGASVSLQVHPADSIQWYRNGIAIPGATQIQYLVTQTGAYYATLFSFSGCSFTTRVQQIDIYQSPVAGFTHNNTDQCFNGNQFIFTNTSTPPTGTQIYRWDMGDGTILTSADVTYSYLQTGTYTVTMVIKGDGGCADSSFVILHVFPNPKAGFKINTLKQCFKNNRFVFTDTSSVSSGTLQYNWDLGDGTLATTRNVTHSYALPGVYTVTLRTDAPGGCTDRVSYDVTVFTSPVARFSVNSLNQCFIGHKYIFTNGTTPPTASFTWDLGDGNIATTTDVNYSYGNAGPYTVKLLADAGNGCLDSFYVNVNVYPMPVADFLVQPICTNLTVPLVNKTINNTSSVINYSWDLGNGQTSSLRSPVYSYTTPGTYTIKLAVNTVQCPTPSSNRQLDVVIDAPLPGIAYPVKDAVMNFREPLNARVFGNSILWKPATSLDNRNSYTPVFTGRTQQLYTIELRTQTGCLTVDTQLVKTHKKIEIYVPTAFSPNGNGINDYLRPVLMGFEKVNYFRIFDRWGKLLFEMKSDKPGWDGKTGNVTQELQTLVWMIEAVDVDGVVHHRQGTTVLLR